ncbi:helix-turn-helix domain-containing protein [Maricaulis maris]|uniref:helix-turn-helix domain-containing protein n=1 Tax=Maricaulis maris TaxID=74318 RepID=UPI003B8DCA99
MTRSGIQNVEVFEVGASLPIHRHADAYAALVLDGSYDEFSFDGRFACRAGDVVLHPRTHAHGNAFPERSARVVSIPLPAEQADARGFCVFAASDLQSILREFGRDPSAAGQALLEECGDRPALAPPDWVVAFVSDVLRGRSVAASAGDLRVSPEHASRTCRAWYGLSPLALRRESRIRDAISALRDGVSPSQAAQIAGFADQPHMTRVLRAQTGQTPGRIAKR